MYVLEIFLNNEPKPIKVPIESFSVLNSEQDISLGGAAIGGLYCILADNDIDKFFHLVQKNVDKVCINIIIEPEEEGGETKEETVYISYYWNRVTSISGSFDADIKKIIATLCISHLVKEDE